MEDPGWARMRPVSRPFRAFLALFLTTALTHGVLARSNDRFDVGVDNFGQINKNYYRGAQPDAAGFRALKQLGIKTVVDLQKDGKKQEAGWVRDAGMQYVNIPLSSTKPATAAQTEYFLKLVNDPANWPVYVHCAGGRHRTGEMTAIYRVTHDTWSADRAFAERKDYDYYAFGGHGSLRDYVYRYYDDFARTATLAKAAPAASTTAGAPAAEAVKQ
jgi:protein tyrosine phosphatase (PTP) superfamily phosphohydrolase (DUF442 family)